MMLDRKRGGRVVALLSAVYFISYFTRKNFAAVMAGMIAEDIISKSEGGLIGTGLFVMYGVGQLVSGYLGDKLKPSHLIIFGVSLTSVCNLLMPIVPGGAFMIPVWAVNGLAQAMLWPPILRLLAENLSGEAFVRANFLVTSAAHVATIILYLYVPVCLEVFSWETVFFSASVISAAVMLLFAFTVNHVIVSDGKKSDTGTAENEKKPPEGSFVGLLASAGIIPILISIITMGYLRDGIDSWLPTLYSESFGKQASESVLVSVVLPIFSIASVMLVTALHKKPFFNNEARGSIVLFGLSAISSLAASALLVSDGAVLSVLCLLFAAFSSACMHGCNFLYISCLPGRFKATGRVSTIGGICNAFVYIGAAVSMYAMALVSEQLGWLANTLIWAAVSILGAISSIVSYKKYTAFISEK